MCSVPGVPSRRLPRLPGSRVSTVKRWLSEPDFLAMVSVFAGYPLGGAAKDCRKGRDGGVTGQPALTDVGRWPKATRCWARASRRQRSRPPVPSYTFMLSRRTRSTPSWRRSELERIRPSRPTFRSPLAGWTRLLENLPLVCRLGSSDERESLTAWLEVWTFLDEDGRTQTLATSLWDGQRRFLEALLSDGHVLSIKSRKVGLSTLVCAHAAWTAQIRDVNAAVHLLSYREDAAKELLRSLHRGFEGLPAFLLLPLERQTSTVLSLRGRRRRHAQAEGVPGDAERGDRGDEFASGAR